MPNGWIVTTLGEAFTLQAGKTISSSDIHEKSASNQFPCFGGNGIRGYVDSYNRNGHYPIIGRQGALCGNINEAQGRFYATEHAVVVETYAGVNVDWVIMLLEAMNLNQYATATAQPGLSVATIKEVKFCLPPLKEQSRIVSELNKWLSAIKTLDSDTVSLAKTIFKTKSKILSLSISGKLVPQDPADEPAINLLKRINPDFVPCDNSHYPFDIPNGWQLCTIGDLFRHNTGKALNSSNRGGVPLRYITTSNLYWDKFDLSETRQMLFTDSEIEKCQVQKGDLLVCEGGDIGRAAIWMNDAPIMIQNHIHKLRPKTDICTRFYLYIFMLYKSRGMIGGKGIGILGLSARELDRMAIPVPPIEEQQRITYKIDTMFSFLSELNALAE